MIRSVRLLAGLWLVGGAAAAAQETTACEADNSAISGRVGNFQELESTGYAALVMLPGGCHGAVLDSAGSFVLASVPAGPTVVIGGSPTTCIEPLEIEVAEGDTAEIVVRAVEWEDSEAQVLVHGTPWLPKPYSWLQCQARFDHARGRIGLEDLTGAPVLPTPDSVISLVLRSSLVNAILQPFDPVRIRLWYGEPQMNSGILAGKAFEVVSEQSDVYVLVRRATPDSVELQIGTSRLTEGGERGVRALWDLRRDRVHVLDRWGRATVPEQSNFGVVSKVRHATDGRLC